MKSINRAAIFAAVFGVAAVAQAQVQPNTSNRPAQNPAGAEQRDMAPRLTGQMQPAIPQWPAGFAAKPVNDRANIFKPVATATEAALTKNGFNDLVERLSKPDRDRLASENFKNKNFSDLNQRVTALQDKFRQKYGSDFKLDDPNGTFDRYVVIQGEVSDSSQIAGRFPLPAMGNQMGMNEGTPEDRARMASGQSGPQGSAKEEESDYLKKGREVAVIALPGEQGAGGLQASLSQEFINSWKIDIPDTVTGQKLHDNLLKQLDDLNNNAALWPEQIENARRVISYHVISALYDVNSQPGMRPAQQMDRSTPTPPVRP